MLKGQRLCTAFAVCAIVALVSSCSRPPSNDIIISAISDYLKNHVPLSLSGILSCDKAQIELIEIKEIGKFHDQPRWWEEAKYWPVKAHVKGTCRDLFSLPKTKTKAFDRAVVFKLYQDDFGNWKASD